MLGVGNNRLARPDPGPGFILITQLSPSRFMLAAPLSVVTGLHAAHIQSDILYGRAELCNNMCPCHFHLSPSLVTSVGRSAPQRHRSWLANNHNSQLRFYQSLHGTKSDNQYQDDIRDYLSDG